MTDEDKSFDEYWAEEEKAMKISLQASKRGKAERYGKTPAKELVDHCEGRTKEYKDIVNKRKKTGGLNE